MSKWYAVRTRSRAEKVVYEQVGNRGVETFLPLMQRVSQWKDRRKWIEWPLFPGYCFARFTNEQRLMVLQCPCVIEIIGSALGRAESIPDSEIEAIQRILSSRQPYEPYANLVEGMAVQVVRGPLIGLQGTLFKKPDGCRIVVRVNLIGQGAAVHINAEDVTPLRSLDAVPSTLSPLPRSVSFHSLPTSFNF